MNQTKKKKGSKYVDAFLDWFQSQGGKVSTSLIFLPHLAPLSLISFLFVLRCYAWCIKGRHSFLIVNFIFRPNSDSFVTAVQYAALLLSFLPPNLTSYPKISPTLCFRPCKIMPHLFRWRWWQENVWPKSRKGAREFSYMEVIIKNVLHDTFWYCQTSAHFSK